MGAEIARPARSLEVEKSRITIIRRGRRAGEGARRGREMFSDGEDDDVLILELGGERIVMPKFREEDDDQDADDEATTSSSVRRRHVARARRRTRRRRAVPTKAHGAVHARERRGRGRGHVRGAHPPRRGRGPGDDRRAEERARVRGCSSARSSARSSAASSATARGRRLALALAMAINALFALLSAAAPDATTLILCRFLAGVGVGGANAAVFSVVPEFLPRASRGKHAVVPRVRLDVRERVRRERGVGDDTDPWVADVPRRVRAAVDRVSGGGRRVHSRRARGFSRRSAEGKDAAAVLRRVASAKRDGARDPGRAHRPREGERRP